MSNNLRPNSGPFGLSGFPDCPGGRRRPYPTRPKNNNRGVIMQKVGVPPEWAAYGASFEDDGLLFQRLFGDPPPGTTVKRERSGNLNT